MNAMMTMLTIQYACRSCPNEPDDDYKHASYNAVFILDREREWSESGTIIHPVYLK